MTARKPKAVAIDQPDQAKAKHKSAMQMTGSLLTAAHMQCNLLGEEVLNRSELTLAEMYEANHERAGAVIDGDLSGLERRLAVQAASLDLLFNQLASRSVLNMGQHLDAAEKYMKLALKAQAQCRTTVEAIHLMHNPTQIIRQTNIAQGHQQVVNSGSAGKLETEQNKLLSADQQPAAQGMLYDLDSRKKAAAV
jgi:hypothetical protein